MRKCNLFLFFVVIISILCLAGCNDSIVETGILEVNIGSASTRGLESVSMETASYLVEVKDSSGNSVWSNSDDPGLDTTYSTVLTAGTYTINVKARNKDEVVIGSGSTTATVQAGKKNTCTVSVRETQGNGTFQMAITGPEGYDLTYSIENTGDGKYTGGLEYSESSGKYSATVELPNGFYEYSITVTGFEKPIKVDTVRITAGQTVMYSAEFSAEGNGKISVLNEIVTTPSVNITLNSERVKEGGSLTVSGSVEGLSGDITVKWLVDEMVLDGCSDMSSFELGMEEYSIGEHTVTLIVSSGDIIWSASRSFTVYDGSLDGHYVGSRSYYNYWYFFEIEGGEITYSYYEGYLNEYEAVPYTTKESDDGTYIIFKTDWRSYDYALFLPTDPADYASKTLLYYEYGVDENGESVDRSVSINLEKKQKAVSWTTAGYEPYSEYCHINLLQSEYVTCRGDSREEHTLNDSGVCTVCGYDGHDFDIFDNSSYVAEGSGSIYICRYWPGEFKLSDGTVVEEGNKFYVKNESGYSGNCYMLYYPACIYDEYEAGGGYADISSAFNWYLSTYHKDFEYSNLYRVSDVKDFFDKLFALEWVEPSSEDVSLNITRREVLSDTSQISSEAERYMFSRYNKNTLSIDGVAITEENGIYFENSGKYVIIYHPMIISDMYEKVDGSNACSGNPFWIYIRIYFPDLNTDYDNYQEMVKTLVEGYVEPKLEDYIAYENK